MGGVARRIKLSWSAIKEQGANLRGRLSDDLTLSNNSEASSTKTDRLDWIGRLQKHEIGVAADRKSISIEIHHPSGVGRDCLEAEAHRLAACKLADMQAHMSDIKHVRSAKRIPRVHRTVLAKSDIDSVRSHLGDAGLTAPLRIAVVAALENNIDEWVGDGMNASFRDQR
jgi:hypothetical protein